MANFRQIHTRMWSADNWFINLSPDMKLLFIYLFSNERASMCGLYELPIKMISFETGLDRDTILRALEVFNKADKVTYDFEAGVIWVKKMRKYQSQDNPNDLVRKRIEADIKAVPDCELKREYLSYTLSPPYEQGADASVYVSSRGESMSGEEGGAGGENPDLPRLAVFTASFGKLHGGEEADRWLALVEKEGEARARELVEWALDRQINLENRPGLLRSMEKAAETWRTRRGNKKFNANDAILKNFMQGAESGD